MEEGGCGLGAEQGKSEIIESLRLEKTSKNFKSNHQPITTMPTKTGKFGKREGSIMQSRSCLEEDLDMMRGQRPHFSINHSRTILAENCLGA